LRRSRATAEAPKLRECLGLIVEPNVGVLHRHPHIAVTAADAVLYEFDPDCRRRIKKERLESEQSFGDSLRRLRKERGLAREDFEPAINAKTVARIEQGKVSRIQLKTLSAFAKRLGVSPEEIESY
jgi:DNA-binding Xre family transcriptional regulator